MIDDVPDPDEDDLDDLDDLLDDFSAAKIDSKAPAPPSGPGRPADNGTKAAPEGTFGEPSIDDLMNDDDFAKQLQAGMADLLGEMQNSPEMQAQFESLFKELDGSMSGTAAGGAGGAAATAAAAGAAGATGSAPRAAAPNPASGSKSTAADASFQETIRRTMERVQASGDQATAAAAADTNNPDDLLAEFMKQMQPGSGNEEELSKMLVGMMEELTNKEILYEPMKELNDKFPVWMEQNRAATAPADLKRYEEQQAIVQEIVTRFELPAYSDNNPADREYIVDRMQKMQAAGSPPPDLVGDMPSAQDALAAPDEACNPQ